MRASIHKGYKGWVLNYSLGSDYQRAKLKTLWPTQPYRNPWSRSLTKWGREISVCVFFNAWSSVQSSIIYCSKCSVMQFSLCSFHYQPTTCMCVCVYYTACMYIIQARTHSNDISRQVGNKLYQIATRFKGSDERVWLLVQYVCEGKLATEPQMTGRCGFVFIVNDLNSMSYSGIWLPEDSSSWSCRPIRIQWSVWSGRGCYKGRDHTGCHSNTKEFRTRIEREEIQV